MDINFLFKIRGILTFRSYLIQWIYFVLIIFLLIFFSLCSRISYFFYIRRIITLWFLNVTFVLWRFTFFIFTLFIYFCITAKFIFLNKFIIWVSWLSTDSFSNFNITIVIGACLYYFICFLKIKIIILVLLILLYGRFWILIKLFIMIFYMFITITLMLLENIFINLLFFYK